MRVTHGEDPPLLLLTTIGRKSGTKRTTPLIYVRDGDSLVVAASNGGHPSHPAWWLNLQARPHARVQVMNERRDVKASEARGPERDRLWRLLTDEYDGYAAYQRKAEREIPVIVLEHN